MSNYDSYEDQSGEYLVFIPKDYQETDPIKLGFQDVKKWSDYTSLERYEHPVNPIEFPYPKLQNIKNLFAPSGLVTKRIYMYGHGDSHPDSYIAQLSISDYKDLLKYFNTIGVTFLVVESCYAGGLHLLQGHQETIDGETKKLDLNFPVVINALTDSPTQFIVKWSSNYIREFFTGLDAYFTARNMESWLKKTTMLGKKGVPVEVPMTHILGVTLKTAIKHLWARRYTNVPSIRFPGIQTTFNLVDLAEQLNILNYPLLLKYELRERALLANPEQQLPNQPQPMILDGKFIALYPSIISLPLQINNDQLPYVISMIPNKARHYIRKIIWNPANKLIHRSPESILINLFITPEESKIPKTFFIKELEVHGQQHTNLLLKFGDEIFMDANNIGHRIITTLYKAGNAYSKTKHYYNYTSGTFKLYFLSEETLDVQAGLQYIKTTLTQFRPDPNALFEATGGRESNVQFEKLINNLKD